MSEARILQQQYEEFNAKLTALAEEYRTLFAPDHDAEGSPCCHAENCDCKPKDSVMLTEWIVVMGFTDLETHDQYVHCQSAPHMVLSHTLGLVEYYRDRLRP